MDFQGPRTTPNRPGSRLEERSHRRLNTCPVHEADDATLSDAHSQANYPPAPLPSLVRVVVIPVVAWACVRNPDDNGLLRVVANIHAVKLVSIVILEDHGVAGDFVAAPAAQSRPRTVARSDLRSCMWLASLIEGVRPT